MNTQTSNDAAVASPAARKPLVQTVTGRVTSDKMDKTVTVEVTRTVRHRKYHKFVTRRKKYHAHDELNECKVDDQVVIQESRPLSRTKRWVVVERRK